MATVDNGPQGRHRRRPDREGAAARVVFDVTAETPRASAFLSDRDDHAPEATMRQMTLLVALVCLATFRGTRLLVADEFPPTAALRDWVDRRWGDDSAQAYLAHCPWCVSVYLGAAITFATDHWVRGGLVAPVLVWGTASAVTGLIASVEPE